MREQTTIEEPEKEKHRRGWLALNRRRMRESRLLRSMRGGFSRGCRNNAALIYAWLLRTNGVPRREAEVEVNLMGVECHPRLTPSECRAAVKTGFGRRMARMLDQTISDRLIVTSNEAAMLERLPPATRFKAENPVPPVATQSEVQARTIMERRVKITEIIAELRRVPSLREMGSRLIEGGFRGNHQTVSKDYRALGVKSVRTLEARTELKSRRLSLPDV
jgi:hypothetical protein